MKGYVVPRGGSRYCAPAALAYVLRLDTSQARRMLSTWHPEFDELIRIVGKFRKVQPFVYNRPLPKLEYWAWFVPLSFADEYMLSLHGHVVVVHRGLVFDNHMREGLPFDDWLSCVKRNVIYGYARVHGPNRKVKGR
jgi:hypothetical protein